jgi:ankyrin repeat protein
MGNVFGVAKKKSSSFADSNAKDEYGKTKLMKASEKGNFEMVKFLVENGAHPNVKNRSGWTALMYASEKGNFKIVKLLVENGADPNVKNNSNSTAFTKASRNRNSKIAVYLMEHFAEIQPWRLGEMTVAAINERIKEITESRKLIKTILFPNDTPVIAQIISEFTDGLENLKKFN